MLVDLLKVQTDIVIWGLKHELIWKEDIEYVDLWENDTISWT